MFCIIFIRSHQADEGTLDSCTYFCEYRASMIFKFFSRTIVESQLNNCHFVIDLHINHKKVSFPCRPEK